jgi:hypothetical protein
MMEFLPTKLGGFDQKPPSPQKAEEFMPSKDSKFSSLLDQVSQALGQKLLSGWTM